MTRRFRMAFTHILVWSTLVSATPIVYGQTTAAARCAALLAEGQAHATPDPNDYKTALSLWAEAFPICQGANVKPQMLAHSAALWATVLAFRGDRAAAESTYREVISRIEHDYSSDSPALLEPLYGLMDLVDSLGRGNESLLLAKRALAVSEKSYGTASTQAAETLVMIGYLYQKKGDPDTAEWYFRSAVQTAKTACHAVPCKSLTAAYSSLRDLIRTQPGREAEAKNILDILMSQ